MLQQQEQYTLNAGNMGWDFFLFFKHQVANPKAKERGMGMRKRGRVRFEDLESFCGKKKNICWAFSSGKLTKLNKLTDKLGVYLFPFMK